MATVNKDFKVKNGLIVEGTTATVNNYDILTKNPTDETYIVGLIGGAADSANTPDTVVLRDANGDFAAGVITADIIGNVTGDVTGTVSSLANHDTDDLVEGASNQYFTNQRALDATSAAYDPAGSAATAESNANTYTDGRETAITTAYQSYADTAESDAVTTAATDATNKANAAESNANSYTDSLIGDVTVDGTAGNTVTDRIATAVSNLVDSAPATLDTLNELAAALQDNPSVITDLQTIASGKQDALTAGSNIDITNDVISVTGLVAADISDFNSAALSATSAAYDAAGSASAAQTAAEGYASGLDSATNTRIDNLDTDDVAEGTNQYFTDLRAQDAVISLLTGPAAQLTNIQITSSGSGAIEIAAENGVADSTTDDLTEGSSNLYFTDARAVSALEAVVPNFTAVEVNSVAKQVAAEASVATASTNTAVSWVAADYRSAEFLVKIASGTHTEVSKVILTLDTSDNIAITEYAMVGTNGSLGSVSADVSGTDVRLRVTTDNNNSTVAVVGTLLK